MAEPEDKKQRIVLELARTRVQLAEQSLLVGRNFDVNQHLANSVRRHSWVWMSVAAIFGWILSRLPARKKKVYIQSTNRQKEKRGDSALLKGVWKAMWSVARPVLVAYLTKRIAQKAKIPGSKWL
jgi:hypothetical protein